MTEEQKEENRNLSRQRIFVENAIGGMKKFNILNFVFRNKKENFGDDVIALCAGLWNMAIIN
ncbi:transposase family protein [Desulfonema ishimotonii]|uniref:transposase family protein n=1 Tax=Desulfonema ishimotonii TaxID=45657 RepID=UPI000F5854D6